MKCNSIIILIFLLSSVVSGQKQNGNFSFALVTDTHIGSSTSYDDLRLTVIDINKNDSLSFVILSGDVTEFGSDNELNHAKQILDSLRKPWYIVPGNHDTKWSESGGNSFRRIFGAETFAFVFGNFLFIGTNSGPNMRMSPGQVPRENIVWLDSLLKVQHNDSLRIIFTNHYPLDDGVNNWYEVIDRLKTKNIQLLLCGHGHSNKQMEAEGIPCIMGRSNLRAKAQTGGYNILYIEGDSILKAFAKKSSDTTARQWASVTLSDHHFSSGKCDYPRPEFTVNTTYSFVKEEWRFQDKSDIGSGITMAGKMLVTSNTDGQISAFSLRNGKKRWQFETGAKIYSTPAIIGRIVVGAATNGIVYALDIRNGKELWSYNTGSPIVASPAIHNERVFIAGSGGKCYMLAANNGSIIWQNDAIEGFVETKPLFYKGMIYFGTWDNHFYALDEETGRINWDRHEEHLNRALSPAACVPVAVNNRIFHVAPDRQMTCLTSDGGVVIWRSDLGGKPVRESMGISMDSTLIYAKTMDGSIIGVSTSLPEGKIVWTADANTGYDISPSVISEMDGIVFVPTDKGFIYAIRRTDGKLLWIHRISSCLINCIMPVRSGTVICTSMDGVITRLSYK